MSLAGIKGGLQTVFEGVTGVTTAYDDTPAVSVAQADLPAVIMARQVPFLQAEVYVNDGVMYRWRFDIYFLFKALGEDTVEAWDDGIEPYPARFVNALYGALTLSGAATDLTVSDFEIGLVNYGGSTYFGMHFLLTVNELVTTTFAL